MALPEEKGVGSEVDSRSLTIGQAATYLGCSPTHLRELEQSGILVPDQRTSGGHRRYSLERLEQYKREGFTATGAVCCYGDPSSKELERNKSRVLAYCKSRALRSMTACNVHGPWNGGLGALVSLLGLLEGGSVRTVVLAGADTYSPDVLGTIIKMASYRKVELCLI